MVGSNSKKQIFIKYLIATCLLLIVIFPYLYLVMHSFADWRQVDKNMFPTEYTLRSYIWLFTGGDVAVPRPWLMSLANSFFVSIVSTGLMLLTGLMVAYALAKLNFKGRNFINNAILFQMFFPAIILLIPHFLIIQRLGIFDTYLAMILPRAVSLWAIFMYTNFFKAIPDEFIEASKIDGASDWQVLFQIVLPMSRQITIVVFLFLFTERWTELLWDMLATRSDNMLTLNVLLSQMFGPYGSFPGPMYAAAVILTMPILILFIIFSRQFQKGLQFTLK